MRPGAGTLSGIIIGPPRRLLLLTALSIISFTIHPTGSSIVNFSLTLTLGVTIGEVTHRRAKAS